MKDFKNILFKAVGGNKDAFEELALIWRNKYMLSEEEINLIDDKTKEELDDRIFGSIKKIPMSQSCLIKIKK